MEWDDERSGGFEPLRLLPKGDKQVVLGLVTTKRGELESRDELLRRIEEAARYAPLEQLCLSPQCGFSSTVEGNLLTEERAVGEAAADRRGRAGSLGLSAPSRTVRDATFDVFRRRGLTTLFANPGSTEVPFLAGLPDDLRFVLALHEGSVVGLATGYALGRGEPALALLHTTAGLGNAVGAIATARVNRAPLVVLVGQQDRRHLVFEPFLTGRLRGLAGDYPVWVDQPVRAQDVPGAVERACNEAVTARGPALVIVPMDDWLAPADEEREDAAARAGPACGGGGRRTRSTSSRRSSPTRARRRSSSGPARTIRRRGRRSSSSRSGSSRPCSRSRSAARAGFPQDHRLFAGVLPADRPRLRERLAPYDAILAVGAPVFRQSPWAAGRFTNEGTRIALVSDDPDEVHRSPVELAVLAPAAARVPRARRAACRSATRSRRSSTCRRRRPLRPAPGEPLTAGHVLAALAERLPREAVVVEEAPVDRPELHDRLLAREPLGFLSAAMGGLGFAVPGATGVRMALPDRPVVAVVGDGSAIYGIQGLWTRRPLPRRRPLRDPLERRLRDHGPARGAARRGRPVARASARSSSPRSRAASAVPRAGSRRTTSCSPRSTRSIPTLASREEPLLLDVVIAPTTHFAP